MLDPHHIALALFIKYGDQLCGTHLIVHVIGVPGLRVRPLAILRSAIADLKTGLRMELEEHTKVPVVHQPLPVDG